GYQLCVGPRSAGAQPGPACYGMGGPLTITDVNLLLGRISSVHFAIPVNVEASERAASSLLADINAQGMRMSRSELLLSFIDIANEKMAEAIRKISVQKGHDPAGYSLLCFGGAGGQHACALASLLDMKRIILPYDAGLLSAFGIGTAREECVREKLILEPLDKVLPALNAHFSQLVREAEASLPAARSGHVEVEKMIFLRLAGQETSLEISVGDVERIAGQFKSKYKQVYGHYLSHRIIEVESIRVLVKEARQAEQYSRTQRRRYTPAPSGEVSATDPGARNHRPVFVWESLRPGALIPGPALIISENSTSFVEAGWLFELDRHNNGVLTPTTRHAPKKRAATAANLALFTNRFTSVVEDMGSLLQRSSFSVNVKERLDFSCALLDKDGSLIVNAPHIPVHLGSLGVCVREIRRVIDFEPGDVVITNHPAFGGSHLPDITLIKPVYFQSALIGYVVNRAHHAEIGGKKPGSMPADAKTLEEEGVIIAPTYLVRKGIPQWRQIESLLRTARYPSRSPDENLADLNGGLAALTLGSSALEALCREHTGRQVIRYMREIRLHAASLMQEKISHLRTRYTATERLDDGSVLCVTITKRRASLVIDFTGTAKVHPGNLNATVAIVNSVVLYVLRLLVGESMPLNEGLFEHVKLIIPTGMLNPTFRATTMTKSSRKGRLSVPPADPAVVGGNTEVSQRLTDTLLKALGLAACSQGTMNNLLFGNARFGYYETICGGGGATPGASGADAVHTHMTNTRITDPEILELKYPVRLDEFSVRKNSGGKGKWRGGNGVIRTFVFMDTLEVNILSQHRIGAPYGMQGGSPGKPGRQQLISDGKVKPLKGVTGFTVKAGDKLIIETPGGGGWGKA
ncbi:MAG TPA: hydantoinase B/oxoprolinase family protein, partial [Chryseolinea sp.]|nr:hydantoinase B/oxoprolinase family protein [Chryseolinea sp.]